MLSRVNHLPIVSLHASAESVALCAMLPMGEGDADWVHLLPAGEITTRDGRGPFRVPDMERLIANSLPAGERLVLDANHATDLAAPAGQPAPAMGWIVVLQARPDGLWGQVEWTDLGAPAVAGKHYRGISPVIEHDKAGNIVTLKRASLVNAPNIKNLKSLHQETDMTLLQRLLKALGLDDTTSEDTLVAAVTTLHQAQAAHVTALNSIGTAAGMKAGATLNAETIVAAIGHLAASGGAAQSEQITALQGEITTLTTSLNTERNTRLRRDAEAFVDGAIKEGRVNVKPLRDHYITRHMADAASVEKEINAFPKLTGGTIVPTTPAPKEGEASLNAEESSVARQLGIDPKAMATSRDQLAGQAATL